MTTNQHNEVTARLLALFVAGGDKEKAEEYLRWAEEKAAESEREKKPTAKSITEKFTEEFISAYLTPNDTYDRKEARRFSSKFIKQSDLALNLATVSARIVKMPYADFLRTTYWRGVAYTVKRRAGYACEICGSKEDLVAHHKTYEHHGDETHHLDDLQCLCRSCHEKVHAKLTDIPMEEN